MILLVVGFATQLRSQTVSNNVCLSAQEFDFYAEALVSREYLKKDTADLRSQIKSYQQQVVEKNVVLRADSGIISNKNQIIGKYKIGYEEIQVAYGKEMKKTRRWKNLTCVLSGVALVLGVIVLIK